MGLWSNEYLTPIAWRASRDQRAGRVWRTRRTCREAVDKRLLAANFVEKLSPSLDPKNGGRQGIVQTEPVTSTGRRNTLAKSLGRGLDYAALAGLVLALISARGLILAADFSVSQLLAR